MFNATLGDPTAQQPCEVLSPALSEQIGLSHLARSLSVQECKTPPDISTVHPRLELDPDGWTGIGT